MDAKPVILSGLDLKLLRISKHVSQTAIAARLRVSRSTVSTLEARERLSRETSAKYLAAIEAEAQQWQ